MCRTAQYECYKAARVCVSCRCLEQYAKRAPQTRQKETRIKGNTEGAGSGKRKQCLVKAKGGQTTHQTPQTRPRRAAKEIGEGKADGNTATTTMEVKGTAGDEPGYNPTPEDLRLQEVYGDWVHANPGTHLEGGIRDNSAWQAW